MKKNNTNQERMATRTGYLDSAIFSERYIDMDIFRLLCSLQPADVIPIGAGKILRCISVVPMIKIKIEYNGIPITLNYIFGNWHASLKAKRFTPQQKAYNALLRDLEGRMVLDAINRTNPFHNPMSLPISLN